MNEVELKTKLRRNQSNLVNAGTGVLLFAVWSVIRSVLFSTTGGNTPDPGQISNFVFLVLFTAFDMFLRYRIFRNATAEGKGNPYRRKKTGNVRNGHLVLSVILLILYAAIIILEVLLAADVIFPKASGKMSYVDVAVSFLINLTSMYILLLILFSTRQVRAISRRIAELAGTGSTGSTGSLGSPEAPGSSPSPGTPDSSPSPGTPG